MAQYTLKLSFDLRQVTQSLAYEFLLRDKTNYPMEDGGPLAGTFNFQQGDEIIVEVMATSAADASGRGTSSKDVLKSFDVKDCTFVSIAARMTQHLSMFDKTSACSGLEEWGPLEDATSPQDEANNICRMFKRSIRGLPVETKHGQWQISGYLSVELTSESGVPHTQLYFFDPEGSSGNGGGRASI